MKWEKMPISSVYEGLYDGPHATPPSSDSGAIFLGISNITENGHLDFSQIKYISENDLPKWTKRVTPREGDIVFSYEATLNLYAMIPANYWGCLGRRMALIRPDESKAYGKFLYYYFFSDEWRATVAKHIVTGVTVDRIPLIKFPSFEVSIPPLPTQSKIVSILSAYDNLIENNQKQIRLLEEAAQRLYQEWFVKLRFPGHENVKIVDGVPEGWKKSNINEIVRFHRGFDITRDSLKPGKYPVVGSTSIIGWHNEYKVNGPGIITGRSGSLGKYQLIWDNYWPHNTSLYVSDFKSHSVLFVYEMLQRIDLSILNGGGAIPTLNRNVLSNIPVIEPTLDMQQRYERLVQPLFLKIKCLAETNNLVLEARNRLLPMLMSGEIEV